VNVALEGKRYPPVRFTVGQVHTERFARIVGQREDGVSPTFPTAAEFAALDQVIADAELALDFERVVHGEQEYVYSRPLAVGDELEVVARIAKIRRRGALGFCTIETELKDGSGEVVVIARNTLVIRGVDA